LKLHELDWQEVLDALPGWEALSPAARRAFVEIRPGHGFAPEALGEAGVELRESGLLIAPTGRGTLYALRPELRPLLNAARAAHRLSPLSAPGGVLPQAYVQDQLTSLQSYRIASPQRGYDLPEDRKLAAETASSVGWLRGFLAAGPPARWEEQRMTRDDRPRLVFPAVAAALRELLAALPRHPRGVPLSGIGGLVPGTSPGTAAAALAAGLRYLLVFVSLDGEANLVVGLLPAIAARMAGPLPPPEPVETREAFAAPFRVDDMTALLVEAATEPIALRASDRTMFVRARRAVAERLSPLPAWVARFTAAARASGAHESERERVEAAAELAAALRLADERHSGDRLQFAPTRAGRAWLNGGEGERFKAVLHALRALPQRTPAHYGSDALDFFGARLPFDLGEARLDVRKALCDAFLSVPADARVSVAGFVRFHSAERNPFLGPEGPSVPAGNRSPRTIEAWETAWGGLLLAVLRGRLVPLGCASLGRAEDGDLAFGITDAGRYLLGASDDFDLAPAPVGGEVLVQPDFEIVFLAPAPRAEAELGRIAERTGSGVGALFRLTRASILRAAEQGMSAGQVLETLRSASRGAIPANVERQVRDWVQSTRTVHAAPAFLITCPDEETAARVRALGGARVTPVSPTLLRLDGDAKVRTALFKRLRERGIFVASS
jgi:hypothetical protein